jgi:hypothetical protein
VKGVGFVRVCASGEKKRKREKIQGSKPLIPLPLHLQGKKQYSVVQNDIVSVFFLGKGNEFGNNPKIDYDSCLPLYNAYGARTLHSKCCR